jgi:arylsulfatase A-like enzyme
MPEKILLVTVDRLPAWILPAWGATWVAAPTLDALAARGIVFDRLLTPALDPRTMARDLLGHGETSLLAASGDSAAVISDQQAIVDAVEPPASVAVTIVAPTLPAAPAADEAATNLGRLYDAATKIRVDKQPGFIWVHAGSLGTAWDAPDELRATYLDPDDPPPPAGCGVPNMPVDAATDPDLLVALRHVFAAQVTLLDRCLATLVEAGEGRDLICVVGLRGMPLGLHDWIGGEGDGPEPRLPYGESIHVPAILVDPAGRMAGQRFGGLATPADLGATLRELASGNAPEATADEPSCGHSLAGLLVNWQAPPRERVIVRGAAGDAVVTPAWHSIVARSAVAGEETLLFAKPDDFFEQANVANRCRDVAAELAAMLAGK